jgi:hypothetical protein
MVELIQPELQTGVANMIHDYVTAHESDPAGLAKFATMPTAGI